MKIFIGVRGTFLGNYRKLIIIGEGLIRNYEGNFAPIFVSKVSMLFDGFIFVSQVVMVF